MIKCKMIKVKKVRFSRAVVRLFLISLVFFSFCNSHYYCKLRETDDFATLRGSFNNAFEMGNSDLGLIDFELRPSNLSAEFNDNKDLHTVAEETRKTESGDERVSSILEDLALLLEEFGFSFGELENGFGVEEAMASVLSFFGGGGAIYSFLVSLFGISVLFLAAELLGGVMGESSGVALAGVCAILSIPVFTSLYGAVKTVSTGLEGAVDFFGGLIPIFTAITSLGGGVATAAAEGSGMALTLSAISIGAKNILLPLVMASFSMGMISSFDLFGTLSGITGGIKSCFITVLGILTTLLAGTLALQTLIGSAKDSLALRGVKYAVSGMIPIVGSSVSSALGALVAGVNLAKGTAGAAAIFVLISIIGAPLAELLLFRLAFSLCLAFLKMTGGTLGAKTLSSAASAFDALISVFAFSGVVLVLEVVVFLRMGVPAV